MALPTPKYSLRGRPGVYEPREDSFLLLDALEAQRDFLARLSPRFAVEIGSGSGVVVAALASLLECACFATDINPEACEATAETAALNGASVDCLNMDLLCNFRENLFDVVLFNPPYVVTESEEMAGAGLNRAWAGGRQGRQVTDRVLRDLGRFLSDRGVCYMVLLKENNLEEVSALMFKNRFRMEIVLERKILGEHLFTVKFSRLLA